MASGRLLLSRSWVIELDPLHSVERRLMVVDTVALVVAFVAAEASTEVLRGPPLEDTLTEELLKKSDLVGCIEPLESAVSNMIKGPIVKQKFWLEKRLEKRLEIPI